MTANPLNTITAIATPSGRGGVGIIRISGKDAKAIAHKIVHTQLQPRIAHFTQFYDSDNTIIDEGIVLLFENPHSFTGEDVVELQAHGSPIVLDQLIKTAIHYGSRMAKS